MLPNYSDIMKKLFLLAFFIFCFWGAAFAQNDCADKGTLSSYTLKYDGIEYDYYLYKPHNLPEDAPLVVVFHGYGANASQATAFGMNPVADKNGFAVCYPCGPKDFKGEHCWDVGYSFHKEAAWKRDDIGFTKKLVKHLQKEHSLSKQNVFATGHSNGGEMCYLLAYKTPNIFAAVAPIAGLTMEWMYRELKPSKAVPLLEIHGTEDVVSNWNGDPNNQGGWGEYIAVPLAASFWAAVNRCTHEQTEVLPLKGNKVIAHRYINGINGNQVWLYEVVEGTHAWPDKHLDTAAEIWKFFTLYLK